MIDPNLMQLYSSKNLLKQGTASDWSSRLLREVASLESPSSLLLVACDGIAW